MENYGQFFFFLDENNKQRLELFTQECQFNLLIIQIIKKKGKKRGGGDSQH
jgi:hypothetical protein